MLLCKLHFCLLPLTTNLKSAATVDHRPFLFNRLQTSIDYSFTAQFLAWMGYPILERAPLASALTEVQPHEREKTVYRCRVMGNMESGKSSFVRGLVGKENSEALPDVVGDESMSVRALTLPNAGKEIYLVVGGNEMKLSLMQSA